jgi:hypothetical protein
MANPHSIMWRKPGRRNAERANFHRLMNKVEAVRIRHGLTKVALAAEIGTAEVVLRGWLAGEAVGRKESVAKINDFLKRKSA